MNTQPTPHDDAHDTYAEEARALLAATAEVTGEQVGEARKRLSAALESGKRIVGQVKDKVVEGAKATDHAVRQNPYIAIGVAVAAGALVGYLLGRRQSRKCD